MQSDEIVVFLTDWLHRVMAGMVFHPDDIKIISKEDDMGLLFLVRVHEKDIGKAIGKNGIHAEAIRTLLRCAGSLYGVRASMKIEL